MRHFDAVVISESTSHRSVVSCPPLQTFFFPCWNKTHNLVCKGSLAKPETC